jgi:[NiFe] hydrogenase diaphorase moiety large subunit
MSKELLLAADQPALGSALDKALGMKPADVVFEVRNSKLEGRGGAGFPAGVKWNLTGAASGEVKYVVCNADEGEPGTFKDRVLIEKYADRLLEGMAIAGYAISAHTGIIYLRAEYPYLVPKLEKAIADLKARGMLGGDIRGSGFSFDVEIRFGAGAYVCGEETALLESLEGRRGEPRNKPPYPANSGYRCSPTIINNVETFVAVTHIILMGGEEYLKLGVIGNSGTKLFSVSGDLAKPGVYELPLGSTLGELLEMADAKNVQAVQVGGASGRTVRGSETARTLSFRDLPPGGSVIVFDKTRNMVEVLENFMEFFVHESCGQCTPCREGNRRLLEAVHAIRKGDIRTKKQVKPLLDLAETMKSASKCGFGQTSSNCFADIVGQFVELAVE